MLLYTEPQCENFCKKHFLGGGFTMTVQMFGLLGLQTLQPWIFSVGYIKDSVFTTTLISVVALIPPEILDKTFHETALVQ
jgi:uncharacterized membrane protein YqjE